MLDLELADERQNEILTRARELVENDGGAWVGQESWGRRRLAYEIDKKTEAVYYLLHFDCEPATLDELTRILKITDGAMRHMAVRRLAGATLGRDRAAAASARAACPRPIAESREPVAAAEPRRGRRARAGRGRGGRAGRRREAEPRRRPAEEYRTSPE